MPKWHVRRLAGAWVAYAEGCVNPSEQGHPAPSWWSAWTYALVHANPAAEVVTDA